MSNHVTEWLNAYLDGELTNGRLHQVEKHLVECETCRAELESLRGLSALLHEVPDPEFPSPERFAAQVNLLLPQKRTPTPQRQLLEVGWWMIPVGLLAAWVFISTAILVGDVVSVAKNVGLLNSTVASFISTPSEAVNVTSTMGQFGMLQGNSLRWAETTESFTRGWFPQIVLQAAVAMLYLTWIVVWWTRQTRQVNKVFIEG
jgi:hypothetical protein